MDVTYLHLPAGQAPPDIASARPFKAVVVVEDDVTPAWRELVSRWLVREGCLYMMAWGRDCSLWDDSVDEANLEAFQFQHIPDEGFVMTTWHEGETLADTFWYALRPAVHPTVDIDCIVIVDISPNERRAEMLSLFELARSNVLPGRDAP